MHNHDAKQLNKIYFVLELTETEALRSKLGDGRCQVQTHKRTIGLQPITTISEICHYLVKNG